MTRTAGGLAKARSIGWSALLLLGGSGQAMVDAPGPRLGAAGQRYLLRLDSRSATERSDGGTSTTEDHDALVAHVLRADASGAELSYNLPADSPPGAQASEWRFPAQVFRTTNGALRLLNRAELDARLDPWLKIGGMTRAACGRLIFTWNAFRIECDAGSVLAAIAAMDPSPVAIEDGKPYSDPDALAPVPLRRGEGVARTTYRVLLAIDPDAIRRAEARTAVDVGELTGKPVTLAAALGERRPDRIAGTIALSFELDAAGQLLRRTRSTDLTITQPGGATEHRTATETLSRERIR